MLYNISFIAKEQPNCHRMSKLCNEMFLTKCSPQHCCLLRTARFSINYFCREEEQPLSHASRASSPFRGAFLDAAPQKPLLKGEGDRLRWWGFAASPHVHPLRQKFFIGAERT